MMITHASFEPFTTAEPNTDYSDCARSVTRLAIRSGNSPVAYRSQNPFEDLRDELIMRGVRPRGRLGLDLTSIAKLGLFVRHRRLEAGMTQGELATHAGVGRRFVVELESGKPTIQVASMLRVCNAIGLVLNARPVDNGEACTSAKS